MNEQLKGGVGFEECSMALVVFLNDWGALRVF